MTRYRPISVESLVEQLVERILAVKARWPRVLVDGAVDTEAVVNPLAILLRLHGHPVHVVSTRDFLRPASLRFERGRTDPDARYTDWLDVGALRREVLGPLEPGGTGEVLPTLWDPVRDRATRQPRVPLVPGGVAVVHGELLLGNGLPADLSVHLSLSPAALARRLPEDEHWALPAYARYESEVDPAAVADVVVRMDDPRHPALKLD
ncbi:uridine kinase [Amycolatopsis suaedae]|uniref:uridine kinase n=1 Tax=Amycolatopsis suaedae TaxID=2510978 RepID=UPI001F0E9923|nr:uridine kinase [Amycolatopsis suaedae]